MKAVIYARYSSENQREESIEGQIRDCENYAKFNDIEIVGTYIDRAFSAKTDDRPDFQRMIQDSSKKFFDIVLVWKLDRFARNRYDSAFYRYTLRKNNVKIVSVEEKISDGPEGIILESMIEGMAEYYSANLSQNVKRGFRENALKGKWNGGNVTFGYKIVDSHYVIDENNASLVKLIFQMVADGKTVMEVYHYLKDRQIRRENGNLFGYTSIRYMLSNKAYIGEFHHSGVYVENIMPVIIEKNVFDKVQNVIAKHSNAPATHSPINDYLLTTKLFCGKCGAMMTAYSGTSKTKKVYQYYCCNRVKHHKDCDKKKINKEYIEELVVNKTIEFLKDDKIIDYLSQLLYDLQQEENTVVPIIERQINDKKKEIENYMSAIQKGAVSETLINKLNETENLKKSLEEELKKELVKTPIFSKEHFKMALCNFRKIDTKTKYGKEKIIDTFINKIYLFDDKMKIIYTINGKEENITLEEMESSSLFQPVLPTMLKANYFRLGDTFAFARLLNRE